MRVALVWITDGLLLIFVRDLGLEAKETEGREGPVAVSCPPCQAISFRKETASLSKVVQSELAYAISAAAEQQPRNFIRVQPLLKFLQNFPLNRPLLPLLMQSVASFLSANRPPAIFARKSSVAFVRRYCLLSTLIKVERSVADRLNWM